MSADIASVNGREVRFAAKQIELPFISDLAEASRALRLVYGEIEFVIRAAPPGWRSPFSEVLVCLDCGFDVDVLAPNAAHSVPFGRCECNSAFLYPLTVEDSGLLDLKHPLSEADEALAEKFHAELSRLWATGSSEEPNSEGVKTSEGTA